MREVLLTMRMASWERAKGELHALLRTYWTDWGKTDFPESEEPQKMIEDFIRRMEEGPLA